MSDNVSNINKKTITIENMNQLNKLLNSILIEIIEEKKKRPGNPNYYKGSKKSNKQMEKEINKCAKEPRPKSCYKDWSADKSYRKSKKVSEYINIESDEDYYDDLVIKELYNQLFSDEDELLERKKKKKQKKSKKKLSKRTRETLKKKAKKANMPLGALTSVYRKGLAAWLTGHRQGVAQHQWAMARVNSFIRGGKTRSVDKSEWKRVQDFRKRKK